MTESMDRVYDCVICHATNHVAKLQCSCCGTIPAQYTGLNHPAILTQDGRYIQTHVAFGAERTESRRGRRLYFRTVPADYYAS